MNKLHICQKVEIITFDGIWICKWRYRSTDTCAWCAIKVNRKLGNNISAAALTSSLMNGQPSTPDDRCRRNVTFDSENRRAGREREREDGGERRENRKNPSPNCHRAPLFHWMCVHSSKTAWLHLVNRRQRFPFQLQSAATHPSSLESKFRPLALNNWT